MNEPLTSDEFDLLVASTSEKEWNSACDEVKKARNGEYPRDWWPKMIASGIAQKVASKWGGSADIKIKSF